ncbi:unnamed protein product, partial [Choristocarpus tenellus]
PHVALWHSVAIWILQPFLDSPDLTVSFSIQGQRHSYSLKLPIAVTCFMEPVQV